MIDLRKLSLLSLLEPTIAKVKPTKRLLLIKEFCNTDLSVPQLGWPNNFLLSPNRTGYKVVPLEQFINIKYCVQACGLRALFL